MDTKRKLFVQKHNYTCGFACLASAAMLKYTGPTVTQKIGSKVYEELTNIWIDLRGGRITKNSVQMRTIYRDLKNVLYRFNKSNPINFTFHITNIEQRGRRPVAKLYLVDSKVGSSAHWVMTPFHAKNSDAVPFPIWDPYGTISKGKITQDRYEKSRQSWGCWRYKENFEKFFLPPVADYTYYIY